MTDAEGRITEYSYDDLNRLVQLVDPLGNVTTYSYDALGNQIGLVDALGREMSFALSYALASRRRRAETDPGLQQAR